MSALIHAATMVTAGVYPIVRSNFVFDRAPDARTVVLVVALISLFWGAWIGCAKDDIKKSLAGSTMSQIGYMMTAGLGVAGYPFAIFHLRLPTVLQGRPLPQRRFGDAGMNDDVDMRHYGLLRGDAGDVPDVHHGLPGHHRLPGFSASGPRTASSRTALSQNILVGVLIAPGRA